VLQEEEEKLLEIYFQKSEISGGKEGMHIYILVYVIRGSFL